MGKRNSSTLIVETLAGITGPLAETLLSSTTEGTTEPSTLADTSSPEAERIPLSLLHIKGARKEGKETIIHSNLWGKERWFAKKRVHSYTNLGNGEFLILIPTAELEYRDHILTEPLATITPYTGDTSLLKQGGAYATLSI